jgi:molybdopterin-guanine dinucleotide biosynthesis protein A
LQTQNNITGIILSGGRSLRMGQNKAFIQIEGLPIIERISTLFKQVFREVIIVTNETELFQNLGSKIYTDIIPNKGALGGLYTGIYYSIFEYSFCVACDMPLINKSLVQFLIQNIRGEDVIVPHTKDGLQPLHALYSKNCLNAIKETIELGKYKILDFYSRVKVKIIEEEDFIFLDPSKTSFINVNTPEELTSIRRQRKLN